MAGGDLGTYGTVLRVTPLTDGTHDLIRMANPGTTFEVGVITRCLTSACRLSRLAAVHQVLQTRMWGSVLQVELAARPMGKLQGSGIPNYRKVVPAGRWNRAVASACSGWCRAQAGPKAATGPFLETGLNAVLATRPKGGRVAGPCERWLSLQTGFRSESGKRFGSDLMTDTPGVSRTRECQ